MVVRRNAYNPIPQPAYNPNSVPNNTQRLVVNGASAPPSASAQAAGSAEVTRGTYTALPVPANNYGYVAPNADG